MRFNVYTIEVFEITFDLCLDVLEVLEVAFVGRAFPVFLPCKRCLQQRAPHRAGDGYRSPRWTVCDRWIVYQIEPVLRLIDFVLGPFI